MNSVKHTLYAHPINSVKHILYAQHIWWILWNTLYAHPINSVEHIWYAQHIWWIVLKRSTHQRLPDDGFVKPKHVGAFIVIFNVNFNILKQFKSALVGLIKYLIANTFLRLMFTFAWTTQKFAASTPFLVKTIRLMSIVRNIWGVSTHCMGGLQSLLMMR
jgi:hypothetical protein